MRNIFFFCVLLSLLIIYVSEVRGACKDTSYPVRVHNTTNYATSKSQVFKIGIAGTFNAGINFCWLVFKLVADVINNSTNILPDVRLELYLTDIKSSDSNAVIATQYLIDNIEAKTIIGGITSSETDVTQLFSRVNKIPQVIPLATSSQFTSRDNYPFLARVIPNDIQQANAVARFMEEQEWKQVLVLYGDEESGVTGLELLKTEAFKRNMTIYSYQLPTGTTDFNNSVRDIREMVERYRIRIFAHYELFMTANAFFPVFAAAGFTGPKYAQLFTYNAAVYCLTYPTLYSWCWGGIGIVPRDGTGPVYDEYLNKWNQLKNQTGWITNPRLAWYFADAVLAVAHSLQNAMDQSGLPASEINGTRHMDSFTNLRFLGITGNISLDSNLERRGSYNWFNFGHNYTQSAVDPVGYYDGETQQTNIYKTIYFADGVTKIYDGSCVCHFGTCNDEDKCICDEGYIGDSCSEKISSKGFSTTGMILVIIIPIIITLIIAIIGVRYIQFRKERVIKEITDKQKSTITRKDIELEKPIGRGASGVVYKGMYRGTEVAVKKIIVNEVSSSAMQEFELESAVMAGLRHPNIVLFMGACMDQESKEMLIVMEFLEKGSLHDILHNTKITFNFEMALHVASQAAKGMNFLHQASPPIIHRDLKSHSENILIDDKWNARIADFGITRMKDLTNTKKQKENKSLGTIFWTAPEVFEGNCNTEKSDCYSFGIVMWELVHRTNPYEGKEPMAVALDVCGKNLRPTITVSMIPEYERLMKDCWAQLPEDRPSFQEISQRLRQLTAKYTSINFGNSPNVDRPVEAPEGNVIFVQTELVGSNIFWDQCPNDMLEAIQLHNQLMRHQMKTYEGYEVENGECNDSFLVAFEDVSNAINFCISFQLSMLRVSWPLGVTSLHVGAKIENSAGEVIWNGLRVRMAISSGVPNSEIDPSTGRTKYFGTSVEKVKKMLSTTPAEVSIVTSELIADLINQNKIALAESVMVSHCGKIPDTARTKLQTVYSLTPTILESRVVPINTDCPYTVLDIDEGVTEGGVPPTPASHKNSNHSSLSWVIPSSEFSIKENIGKGSVGDYYHATWNGKDIATKFVLNQKMEELDRLHLKAKVSEISKIKHKNLTEVYGVCFDPGQISLLLEYLPQSGLREMLSNDSITISWPNKLKIVKQIADGMAYLSTFSDPEICIFANLKSGNILVDRETYNVKISDYGQGILKDLGRTLTSVGTVAWTAPEILMGEEITPAISVYSFGIIMYEIFTRKNPYPNEHPVKLVGKIISGYRPTCGPEFPAEYKELMEKCWDANPSERPEWTTISNQLLNMLAVK